MKRISVDQLMSEDIITVSPYDTLEKVSEIFENKLIHHIPVELDHVLVGIVSSTDFERAMHGRSLFANHNLEDHNKTLKEITFVSSVMTKDVSTIEKTADIRDAYLIFKSKRYRSLVVMNGGKMVGILTLMDFLDHFFKQQNL